MEREKKWKYSPLYLTVGQNKDDIVWKLPTLIFVLGDILWLKEIKGLRYTYKVTCFKKDILDQITHFAYGL